MTGRAADEAEIRRVLTALAAAHHRLDATGLSALYAGDADWTDSGVTRRGRAAIVAHLSARFAFEAVVPEVPLEPPVVEVSFVHADVAVVRSHLADSAPRPAHALVVMRREADRWLIAAEILLDSR